ncbi:hypothetical protein UFOVP249_41 [uncultured Caudovirales phage]|uniref:Uncharacterized protein n=1 Tax=uncultured Caudovirales phage TaxID=2100421 RepID=A0A6J5LGY4_9CAUD|nr:hypothetical protein UFOVP249_41 [uncultured Caudovirales phage]
MSTSGTTTWQLNRDAVITAALRKLGVLSGGGSAETYQITAAAEALNAMIKGFYADGMPVWAIKSYNFTPVANIPLYQIGVGKTLNTDMPLKILQAWRNQSTSVSNIPMNIYTNYNYDLLPLSNAQGVPINLYYQPLSTYGEINLWPKPQDSTYTITIRYQRPFEDMNAATDDFDFPSYWTEAMIYGLASRLAPEYGLPLQDRQAMKAEAEYFHQNALQFGVEEGSLFFQPDWSGKF